MKTSLLPILLFTCFSLLLTSCEDEPTKAESEVSSILQSVEGGDLRGSTIGDRREDVLRREEANIVHNMPDELTCRIPTGMKDSTFYDITYNFNEQGLYVIELDVFPKDASSTKALFNDFQNYYNQRYGTSSSDDGYTTWFTQSNQGTDIEITMIDESKEMNKPYLSLTFYEHSLNE